MRLQTHLSEACEMDAPHVITHMATTDATVFDVANPRCQPLGTGAASERPSMRPARCGEEVRSPHPRRPAPEREWKRVVCVSRPDRRGYRFEW